MSSLIPKASTLAFEMSMKSNGNRYFVKISPKVLRSFTSGGNVQNDNGVKKAINRKERVAQQMEALKKMMAMNGSNSSSGGDDDISSNQITKQEEEEEQQQKRKEQRIKMDRKRKELLIEARAITNSHYRRCLRCVDIIRPGNDYDEAQFKEREEEEKRHLDENLSTMDFNEGFSVSLPVDRKNELASRANYYEEWIKENFHGEKDCLDNNPWHEENVNRFVELIRRGEKKRKWILDDYKFDDIYSKQFDHNRVDEFEKEALALVKDVYNHEGWVLRSELSDDDYSNIDEPDDLNWDDDR